MRVTLDIDDDLLLEAKEQARQEERSLSDVVSGLVRAALTASRSGSTSDDSFFGFEPLPSSKRTVSNALIDALREEESV